MHKSRTITPTKNPKTTINKMRLCEKNKKQLQSKNSIKIEHQKAVSYNSYAYYL
jgi:hypothetical protein